MQELTIVTFFAQTAQPMLAHNHLVSSNVSIAATLSMLAAVHQEKFAHLILAFVHAREGQLRNADLLADLAIELEIVAPLQRAILLRH